jgi:outer membrane protein assembly factor BamB
VDGGTLFTMYRRGDQDVVVAVAASTGRTIWEYGYDAPFIIGGRDAEVVKEYHLEQGVGPMATPLIVGDSLFTVGGSGKFHHLHKKTGRVIWSKDLILDLQGYVRQRGYTCSPLAYKDTVIVPVGAVGGAVMAFNQKDGAILWRKHDFRHAYASPFIIDVDGQEQLVLFMENDVIGIEPNTGDLLWSHPANKQGTNVSTPVWGAGNLLFVSASYGYGSHGFKLTRSGRARTTIEKVWSNPKVRLHFANAMRIGDVVYGSSGDFGPAFFTALDARTGQILWQDRRLAKASFVYADGRFILIDEDGQLVLAKPMDDGLMIISRVQLLEAAARTPPTLVGRTLYLRDRKAMVALDVG